MPGRQLKSAAIEESTPPTDSVSTESRERGRRRRRRDLAVLIGLLAVVTMVGVGSGAFRVRVSPASHPTSAGKARASLTGGTSGSSSGALPFSETWLASHPQAPVDVKGESAVLVDVDTHQVLWARDPHSIRAPASLTKLVTAMVVADSVTSLEMPVRVPPEADVEAIQQIEPASTVMGINAGEVLTVRELLTGLFLRSGNDAAEALARGIGLPRDRFIELMNEKARAIGMKNSHFTTPVGLDDPNMMSTAFDLAVAAYTIDTRYPQLAAIADQPELHIPATSTHKAFDGVNWLHSFFQNYPGASGMKTGYTDDAGGCTVTTA